MANVAVFTDFNVHIRFSIKKKPKGVSTRISLHEYEDFARKFNYMVPLQQNIWLNGEELHVKHFHIHYDCNRKQT